MAEQSGGTPIYKDSARPVGERVADLLARMTLDEKIVQLGSVEPNDNAAYADDITKTRIKDGIGQLTRVAGASNYKPKEVAEINNSLQKFLVEETRLGIPAMVHEECCSGYMAACATCFPQIIGVASTWTPELVNQMATVISKQMKATGAHQGLSPVLDVARDPRWGRTEETFGEDPFMITRMGVEYVKGLQGANLKEGIAATGKHFVGYSVSEGGLNWAPAKIMPRELQEVFLMPFEAAVKVANLASMMNAYHEFDGVPCGCSKDLLTELLRNQWGFDGIVVSDYHTVPTLAQYHHVAEDKAEAAAMALEAGIDVELPHTDCYGKPLHEAVEKGLVSEELIDKVVARILKMKFEMGLFENPYVPADKVDAVYETSEQRALAREIAQKSIVLLKNKDSLLPLNKDISSIAVIGPNADSIRHMVGDYSHASQAALAMALQGSGDVNSISDEETVSVTIASTLRAITTRVSSKTVVNYAKGCEVNDPSTEGIAQAVEVAQKSDIAVLVVGEKSGLAIDCTSGEFRDRADLNLPGAQEDLVRAVCETGKPVIIVLINGRPLSISWIAENAAAIIEAWVPGEEGGEAVADILFGDYNPGGKLPITVPRTVGQVPLYYNHKPSGARSVIYGDYVSTSCSPLFAFGHGLSYTRFEYSDLRIEPDKAAAGGEIKISVDVKNIGEREGDEIVQLYVHDAASRITRPVMELKGFKRLTLKAGEKRTITFMLFVNQLGFCDADMNFVVEPGITEVMIGAASDDIRLRGEFEITGDTTDISDAKVFFGDVEVM